MATIEYAAPIPLQDLNLFSATSGTPTFSTSNLRSGGGSHKMVCTSAGAVARADIAHASGKRTLVETIYFRPESGATPSANTGILTWVNANGNGNITWLVAGGLRAGIGATVGAASAALTQNQWYRIDIKLDTSGATATLDWWLDGVYQYQVTNSQAAADVTTSRIGFNSAITATGSFMDHAGSYTLADAPLNQTVAKL